VVSARWAREPRRVDSAADNKDSFPQVVETGINDLVKRVTRSSHLFQSGKSLEVKQKRTENEHKGLMLVRVRDAITRRNTETQLKTLP